MSVYKIGLHLLQEVSACLAAAGDNDGVPEDIAETARELDQRLLDEVFDKGPCDSTNDESAPTA